MGQYLANERPIPAEARFDFGGSEEDQIERHTGSEQFAGEKDFAIGTGQGRT